MAGAVVDVGWVQVNKFPTATRMAKPTKKGQLKTSKRTKSKPTEATRDLGSTVTVDIANPELLKNLASNNEEVREKAVAVVSQLVASKRKLESFQLQKLWKGLWYTMWHSDTPLVQQTLARDLAALINKVAAKNVDAFVEAFWTIAIREWSTLDRYRINKFYMLVRFVINAEFTRLQDSGWNADQVALFANNLVGHVSGPLSYANSKTPHSLRLHLIDIYIDELAKVIESSSLPQPQVLEVLLRPLLSQTEHSEFKHIKNRVAEDVLTDERLVEWKVIEAKKEDEETVDSDWEGFD